MKKKRFREKILATVIFSFIAAIVLIIHGVFLDLDPSQISRLTIEGFIVVFIMTLVALFILEWIFTLEEEAEIEDLKKRIKRLEGKKKKKKR